MKRDMADLVLVDRERLGDQRLALGGIDLGFDQIGELVDPLTWKNCRRCTSRSFLSAY